MGTHDLRLRLAQLAEREGKRCKAANLYAQVLQGNPYIVEAWWGLSQTVKDVDRQQYCLERVIALTPDFTPARCRLAALTGSTEPHRD